MGKQKAPVALGTENIGKLLIQYAAPAIIATTAASLYNIIDSIFIGHGVGALAISGLALTFPLMNLAAAFGSLVGMGASILMSIRLGQKDYDTARRVLGNVVVLNIIIGLAFTAFTLPFLDPILYFFGASGETIGYARDFMQVILFGNIITHLYWGLNSLLRSVGHPQKAMAATIVTVIINIILAPLFIYGFGWGIRGAALATVIAQSFSLLWLIKLFNDKNELLHFSRNIFRLKRKIVYDSLMIGTSPFLMNLAACFVVIFINKGLKMYGNDLTIGAYGIINRLIFVFVMIVMGLNQGMQPIAGYNFGAQLYSRVTRVLKLTIYGATIVMTICFLIGMFIPEIAVSIFTSDEELIRMAAEGLRIVVMMCPIVGFQMVVSNFFQCIGVAWKAILLSLTRQLLFLIPFLLVFPRFLGVTGIWISMPAADFIASIITAIMLGYQYRSFKNIQRKPVGHL
ncbi:Multidrug export protein MepA [termite gut metagenome]|uniref:Multidrug export protein MepA n=2 Tax=termite gut metagenome TaxID=433724 RepID=A0A5J4QFP9_9ZZZZ